MDRLHYHSRTHLARCCVVDVNFFLSRFACERTLLGLTMSVTLDEKTAMAAAVSVEARRGSSWISTACAQMMT